MKREDIGDATMDAGPLDFFEGKLSFLDGNISQDQLLDRDGSDGLEILFDDGDEDCGAAAGQRFQKALAVKRNNGKSEHDELTQSLRMKPLSEHQNRAEERRLKQENIDRERRKYEEDCKRWE